MVDTPRRKRRAVRKKQPAETKTKNSLSLFNKKKKDAQNTPDRHQETVSGNGQVVQHKSALLGTVLAWAVVAFVILGAIAGFANLFTPTSTAEKVVQVSQTPEEQQAAEYARGFVGAWLRATKDDDSEVARYMQIERSDITAEEATEYRDLAVASSHTADNGVTTVIISAEVPHTVENESLEDDEEEPQEVWQPAWYQVNIHHQDGRFVPLGWPAPVPAPETGGAPRLSYAHAASDEITETVADFFEAYALGEGDVTRLTHPESTIQPLEPAQYSHVEVLEVTTDEDHHDSVPEDETTTRAYVQLSLGNSPDAARAATYALTLEARGGRWEVRNLDPAPQVSFDQIIAEADQPSSEQTADREGETDDLSTD